MDGHIVLESPATEGTSQVSLNNPESPAAERTSQLSPKSEDKDSEQSIPGLSKMNAEDPGNFVL